VIVDFVRVFVKMASKEDGKALSGSGEQPGKSKSKSRKKHRDASESSVMTEKTRRSRNGKRHLQSAKSSVVGAASNDDSVDTDATNRSKAQGPSKKSILKYMIHEVRELRRQLDPTSEELGSRYGDDNETDLDNGKMNQTFPPSGSGKGNGMGLMHTAPFMATIFHPTADTNDLAAGEAVAMDTARRILDQLRE